MPLEQRLAGCAVPGYVSDSSFWFTVRARDCVVPRPFVSGLTKQRHHFNRSNITAPAL